MTLPLKMLLEPVFTSSLEDQNPSNAPLLDYVYRVSVKDYPCLCSQYLITMFVINISLMKQVYVLLECSLQLTLCLFLKTSSDDSILIESL